MKEPKREDLTSPAYDLAPETASSSVDRETETLSSVDEAEVAPVALKHQGKATKVQEVQWSNFGSLGGSGSFSDFFTDSLLSQDINAAVAPAPAEDDFFSFTNQASSDVGSNRKQQYDDVSFFDLQSPRLKGRASVAVDGPSHWGAQPLAPQAPARLESEKQRPVHWESRGREEQAPTAQMAEDASWQSVQLQTRMDQLRESHWNNPVLQFGQLNPNSAPWLELAEYPGWLYNTETGEWAERNQRNAGKVTDACWDDMATNNQMGDVTAESLIGEWQDREGTRNSWTNFTDASQAGEPTASAPSNDWVGDQVNVTEANVKSNPLSEESVVRENGSTWQESTGEAGGSQPQSRWEDQDSGYYYDYNVGENTQCDQVSPANSSSTLPQVEVQPQSALLPAVVVSEQATPLDGFSEAYNPFNWSRPQIQRYSADGHHLPGSPDADDGAAYSALSSFSAPAQVPVYGQWATTPHYQHLNNSSYHQSGMPHSNHASQQPDSLEPRWGAFPHSEPIDFQKQPQLSSHGQYNSFATAQLPGHTSQSGNVMSPYDTQRISQLAYQTPPKSLEEAMRNSTGRPPHVLTCFGFGGTLLIMKLKNPLSLHPNDGHQSTASVQAFVPGLVHVYTLSQIVAETAKNGRRGTGILYFGALNRTISSGPLMGGGVSSKELYKWLDERAGNSELEEPNLSRLSLLPKLWALLKLTCKHYGKLRSQAGSVKMISQEEDSAEAALGKLLTSGGDQSSRTKGSLGSTICLQPMPSEHQLQVTASEVKKLLVIGKLTDALKCAQQGQLWGPALVLARQLGEQFYADTVAIMAQSQFLPGSPLRTLSLLLAGQPAEVFMENNVHDASSEQLSLKTLSSGNSVEGGLGSMLEEWEENLSIMAANRTTGDDSVISHLGDCLWTVKGEVAAAHICYLVADANFDSFSSSARLCLVGADHWKNPRTYATPEAIQRTEVYEYSKISGNPQFILAPFQPYKVIYASMLAEAGKTTDALRYCQSVLKILKASSRSPQTEACRSAAASLEERLKLHSQGLSTVNLAPVKLVKGLLSALDRGIHGIIGGPPLSAAPDHVQIDGTVEPVLRPVPLAGDRYSASPSRLTAPLGPSASAEKLKERGLTMPQRSVSEPDFSAKLKERTQPMKPNNKGTGYLHRFGSVFSKAGGIVSLVSKSSKKEAKLGDKNAFYYDEKLKMWVEEGSTAVQEEAALPPPPMSTYTSNNGDDLPSEVGGSGLTSAGSSTCVAPPAAPASSSKSAHFGTPPVPPSNQFSARSRQQGVRSRYVDTFNRGNSTTPLKTVRAFAPTGNAGAILLQPMTLFVPGPAVENYNGSVSSSVNGILPESSDESHIGRDLGAALGTVEQQRARQLSSVQNFFFQSEKGVSEMHLADGSGSSAVQPSSDGPKASLFGEPAEESVTSSSNEVNEYSNGYHSRASSWSGYPSNFQISQKDMNFSVPDAPVTQFTKNNGFSMSAMSTRTAVGSLGSYFPASSEIDLYSGITGAQKEGTFLSNLLAIPPFTATTGDDPRALMSAAEMKGSNELDASLLGDDLQEVEL